MENKKEKNICPEKEDTEKYWMDYVGNRVNSTINNIKDMGFRADINENSIKRLVAFSAILLPYIRAIFYAYQRGRFSVYDISSVYISLGDNIVQECIFYAGIIIAIAFISFINLSISPRKEKRWKKIAVHLIFYFVEYVILSLIWVCVIGIHNMIEYKESKEIRGLFLLNWVLILLVNIPSFYIKWYYWMGEKAVREESSQLNNGYKIKKVVYYLLGLAILSSVLFVSYGFGYTNEKEKNEYKCVREDNSESENDECENGYVYYAILDEQPSRYIVCALTGEGNQLELDTSKVKIIDNKNVEVFSGVYVTKQK